MPEINVSREALSGVKLSLRQFATDTERIPFLISKHTEQAKAQCEMQINQLIEEIRELEAAIRDKERELNSLRSRLEDNIRKIRNIENQLVRLRTELEDVESKISTLQAQLSYLQRALSSAESDEEKSSIQNQINDVQARIGRLQRELWDIEEQITLREREKKELVIENDSLKSQIYRTEQEIERLKRVKNVKENKLERMKSAYVSVKTELDNLNNSARHFSRNALETTESNISGVERCIQHIDEYMATDL